MIRGCSLFIRDPDPDLDFLPIPDLGVEKAPDPGSGFATLFFSDGVTALERDVHPSYVLVSYSSCIKRKVQGILNFCKF
jgi:hypothetical protein